MDEQEADLVALELVQTSSTAANKSEPDSPIWHSKPARQTTLAPPTAPALGGSSTWQPNSASRGDPEWPSGSAASQAPPTATVEPVTGPTLASQAAASPGRPSTSPRPHVRSTTAKSRRPAWLTTSKRPDSAGKRQPPSEFALLWANQVHSTPRPYDARRDCGLRTIEAREARVVGGRDSHLGELPWSVLIRETSLMGFFVKTKCGGVLIDLKWVLTAAHCQPGMFGSLIVVVGEYDLGLARSERLRKPLVRKVKRMIIHRDYNPSNFDNDIALLELESPFQVQPHVVPICLPEKGDDFIGHQALVAGWGKLSFGGPVPSVLQVAKLPVIGNKQCQEMYHNSGHMKIISDSFVCAGYENGGQDSCEGDSGGPLQVQRAHDKRWVLVGTVSHGIKCAEPNLPGIYIRTAAYLPWIKAITYHQDHNKRYGPNIV